VIPADVRVGFPGGGSVWLDLQRIGEADRPAHVAACMATAFGPGRLVGSDRADWYEWVTGEHDPDLER
jgi:hypothetical protein